MTKVKQEPSVLAQIHEASLLSSRLFNHEVKSLGLTHTQWTVIHQVYINGEKSQSELARSLSLAKPPLGKMIDLLERDGWLVRRQNPEDRRENLVSLTNKVNPLIAPLAETAIEISRKAFRGISIDQQKAFCQILEQITGNIQRSLEPPDQR